jgi:hypothetical protein
MMVGSKSSKQRPDTLMQDRRRQVDSSSCNARPDHTLGSKALFFKVGSHFQSTPISGRFPNQTVLRIRDGSGAVLDRSEADIDGSGAFASPSGAFVVYDPMSHIWRNLGIGKPPWR